jgi:hypothetical protein
MEREPPFAERASISIESKGETAWNDGCNTSALSLTVNESGDHVIELTTKLLACREVNLETGEEKDYAIPGYDRLWQVVPSVVAYEFREEEFWLFYPESKSNALVFR